MSDSHVSGGFGSLRDGGQLISEDCRHSIAYKIIKLDRGDSLVNTRDDLLSDSSWIDMFGVESITETRDTSGNFIKLNAFFAIICSITVMSVSEI